ncbi:MAG: peptidoglycan DD-metalloendopeptidase family protein [Methanoregula sp.]|nr:peptidoglycan DD-metalloendopeptidase family protein [Methanoregula sp.]
MTGLLLLSFPGFSQSQNSRENLQKTKKQLEQEILYINTLLEQTQKSKQSSLSKLSLLTRQIEKRESLLRTITAEIDQIDEEIVKEAIQVRKLSEDIRKMKEEYARMIYFAYKNLNIYNRIMFIFAAKDFNQAFSRLRYYQQYSSYRRTQTELIRKSQTELTVKLKSLEETKTRKTTLALSKEKEKTRLMTEKEDKDKSVKELSKKEKQLVAKLKEKQQSALKLQIEIEKLIAREIRASAARATKTAKEENKPKPEISENEIMLTPVEKELSTSFASNKGKLPWPSAKGVITGTFGEHPHPVLKYVKVKNNGIDIATEEGADIRAVFSGKVSRVMSFPNLNNIVIIRHGEYLTVYSNLDKVTVKDGQTITTKQSIGKVTSSPDDAKTEYHFEIWKGKTIQDPQAWLAGTN